MTGDGDWWSGRVDQTEGDRQPIHIPGYVQTHGFLLVFEAGQVVQASADASAFLGSDNAFLDVPFGEPVVRMTNFNANDHVRRCSAAGASVHVCKSMDLESFFSTVKTTLGNWRQVIALATHRRPTPLLSRQEGAGQVTPARSVAQHWETG